MDDGFVLFICGLGVGVIFGFLFFMLLQSDGVLTSEDELGQAICEQEYDMDFDYAISDSLYCKPKIVEENYDGIIVKLKDKEVN